MTLNSNRDAALFTLALAKAVNKRSANLGTRRNEGARWRPVLEAVLAVHARTDVALANTQPA